MKYTTCQFTQALHTTSSASKIHMQITHMHIFASNTHKSTSEAFTLSHVPFNCLIILPHEPTPTTDGYVQIPRVRWIKLRSSTELILQHVKPERWSWLHNEKVEHTLAPALLSIEQWCHNVAQCRMGELTPAEISAAHIANALKKRYCVQNPFLLHKTLTQCAHPVSGKTHQAVASA